MSRCLPARCAANHGDLGSASAGTRTRLRRVLRRWSLWHSRGHAAATSRRRCAAASQAPGHLLSPTPPMIDDPAFVAGGRLVSWVLTDAACQASVKAPLCAFIHTTERSKQFRQEIGPFGAECCLEHIVERPRRGQELLRHSVCLFPAIPLEVEIMIGRRCAPGSLDREAAIGQHAFSRPSAVRFRPTSKRPMGSDAVASL